MRHIIIRIIAPRNGFPETISPLARDDGRVIYFPSHDAAERECARLNRKFLCGPSSYDPALSFHVGWEGGYVRQCERAEP